MFPTAWDGFFVCLSRIQIGLLKCRPHGLGSCTGPLMYAKTDSILKWVLPAFLPSRLLGILLRIDTIVEWVTVGTWFVTESMAVYDSAVMPLWNPCATWKLWLLDMNRIIILFFCQDWCWIGMMGTMPILMKPHDCLMATRVKLNQVCMQQK